MRSFFVSNAPWIIVSRLAVILTGHLVSVVAIIKHLTQETDGVIDKRVTAVLYARGVAALDIWNGESAYCITMRVTYAMISFEYSSPNARAPYFCTLAETRCRNRCRDKCGPTVRLADCPRYNCTLPSPRLRIQVPWTTRWSQSSWNLVVVRVYRKLVVLEHRNYLCTEMQFASWNVCAIFVSCVLAFKLNVLY